MTTIFPPVEEKDEFGRSIPSSNDDEARLKERLLGKFSRKKRSREEPMNEREPVPLLQIDSILQGRVVRLESYGAFLELKYQHGKRGLLHISQMSLPIDVLQMGQELYVRILEVEGGNGDKERIRLSTKGINQETGHWDASSMSDSRNDRVPPRTAFGKSHHSNIAAHALQRAKERQSLLAQEARSWSDVDSTSTQNHPSWLRLLWSVSPEPPMSRKIVDDEDGSSNNSVTESDTSSSSSSESSRRYRSRKKRSSRRKRHSSHGRHGRKRRRKRYSSSSSSSSSDDSTSTGSGSSSSAQGSGKEGDQSVDNRELEHISQPTNGIDDPIPSIEDARHAHEFKDAVQGKRVVDSDDDEDVGPQPLPLSNAALGSAAASSSNYGKALLPGEGQALAQYVQQNQRIPRRGEIGYSSTEIEKYEQSGFVMSGSRHARMNAVRLRKENQVYSAEEKRALALITMEEQKQKEAGLMEDFRKMLQEKEKKREELEKGRKSQL